MSRLPLLSRRRSTGSCSIPGRRRAHACRGGNARAFDWSLLASPLPKLPWLLSGGLTAGNLAEAVRVSGARTVDVSSGVERNRGVKDPELVRAFLEKAASL